MKERDLFVFAGQSNMMGAAVLPPKLPIKATDSYEYKHKARRLGASCGEFVPAGYPCGEFSYAEDTFLSSQLVGYSKTIAFLDKPLYHYRKTNPAAMTRNGLKRRKGEYAANFLDLYEAYKDSTHPLRIIFDDVFLQAGWYSMIYGLGLFKSRPYLAGKIREAKVRGNSNTWIPLQLFVKMCSYFRKK